MKGQRKRCYNLKCSGKWRYNGDQARINAEVEGNEGWSIMRERVADTQVAHLQLRWREVEGMGPRGQAGRTTGIALKAFMSSVALAK